MVVGDRLDIAGTSLAGGSRADRSAGSGATAGVEAHGVAGGAGDGQQAVDSTILGLERPVFG